MTARTVVIKVGGSLLEFAGLAKCIRELIQLREGCSALFVIGGGATADVVRRWQTPHELSDEQAHWLAIESMGLNEQLLQTLVPELRLVRSGPQFAAACRDGVPALLCAACFVRWGEATDFPQLPHSWRVTSDSIAAWVAAGVGAEELVLVKSRSLDRELTLQQAAARGLVDDFFPECAGRLPKIGWCNARAEALVIESWFAT